MFRSYFLLLIKLVVLLLFSFKKYFDKRIPKHSSVQESFIDKLQCILKKRRQKLDIRKSPFGTISCSVIFSYLSFFQDTASVHLSTHNMQLCAPPLQHSFFSYLPRDKFDMAEQHT